MDRRHDSPLRFAGVDGAIGITMKGGCGGVTMLEEMTERTPMSCSRVVFSNQPRIRAAPLNLRRIPCPKRPGPGTFTLNNSSRDSEEKKPSVRTGGIKKWGGLTMLGVG